MDMLIVIIGITFVAFIGVLIAFLVLNKKNQSNQSAALQRAMNQAGKAANSSTAFFQKVYLSLTSMPIIKRYVFKIRRRLELLDNDDEYTVRSHTGKTALIAISVAIGAIILCAFIFKDDLFMMLVSFIGVLVFLESLTDSMVNKLEDKLLKQQLELFSEVRHAFHETNMVEEAIYEASLMEDYEVTFQADRIYEIMISADPESELEKYYDVAPNRFLKAFAGVSYLTKEFGDRRVGDISLYLKNMNNITQELQLEIMKRDKIDYLFQSLSYIALSPMIMINFLKNWAVGSFESTRDFYEGKWGFAIEILILIMVFLCYALLRKVKENDDRIKVSFKKDLTWQERIYRTPIIETFIDKLMPSPSKKEYVKLRNLIKETGTDKKIEWIYVERVVYSIIGFFATLVLAFQLHNMAIQEVLTGATKEEAVFGSMSADDMDKANALTSYDTYTINYLLDYKDEEQNERGKIKKISIVDSVRNEPKEVAIGHIEQAILKTVPPYKVKTREDLSGDINKIYEAYKKIESSTNIRKASIQKAIMDAHINYSRDDYVVLVSNHAYDYAMEHYEKGLILEDVAKAVLDVENIPLTAEQVEANATRIYNKLVTLTNEYLKWFEVVIAFIIAYVMYQVPVIILTFQRKLRAMEMENEVMQFQTVILMLMYIERVSVEYIIEWLERFAVIFKEPLSTCLNNYESGAYEALEQLKDDAPYKPFVRIVESLQSAVENVKLTDAFDELETERAFFQEKRKEANERLIKRKAAIGRVIGFAPMVTLFVGYLIAPLVLVSITDMMSYFTQMGSML